jgi:hypothetical protein
MPGWLEEFWGDILSEQPLRIVAAFTALGAEEKTAVYDHLQKMAHEAGWAAVQRDAAQAALAAIGEFTPDAAQPAPNGPLEPPDDDDAEG